MGAIAEIRSQVCATYGLREPLHTSKKRLLFRQLSKRKQLDIQKEYRRRHLEKLKAANATWLTVRDLLKRYKLSIDELHAMYERQDFCCAICGNYGDLGGRRGLYVDHCHKAGHVRGLLCSRCNSGIGKLGESTQVFFKAAAYCSRHRKMGRQHI